MKLYNTLSRRVEEIICVEPGAVRMYSCGPTVYRYIHVGNLRTFTMADWIRRALEYSGLRVTHVKNITDVGHMRQELLDRGEDKMIAQARKEGKTSAQIAAFYTQAFMEDERQLNILPAHVFPRATDHIPEMLAIVERLLDLGIAYESDGTVFYDVTRFPAYGALSGNQLSQSPTGDQDEGNQNKRHPEDFPIWKRAEPGREMAWDSPWGRGFPGWHIECSAMAIKYLGPHFELHTGGVDNLFPHHEDEIAQSEAYTGEHFVNHWVHAQHLLSDGLKMAKSTGNAYTLADVIARGFEPMALRYFYTTAHYRSRINFTFSALTAAQVSLNRLRHALLALWHADGFQAPTEGQQQLAERREAFLQAIDDDLNVPRALSVVWSLLRGGGTSLPPGDRLTLILDFDHILGLDLQNWLTAHADDPMPGALQAADLPEQTPELLDQRATARRRGEYRLADELRVRLKDRGLLLRDTRTRTYALRRPADDGFAVLSRSSDAPNRLEEPDAVEFSVQLVAHNSRGDLQRCIESVLRHSHGYAMEIVVVDNGSTDDTLDYLRRIGRAGLKDAAGAAVAAQIFFADHDMGHAAARNAAIRACRGRIAVLLDTSIEVVGDIWSPIAAALVDPETGFVGPYGLVTSDLKEFAETDCRSADAVEGYLIALRRSLVREVGLMEERFRFYRLLDIYMSFMCKTAGYQVVRLQEVADLIVKHPHREWFSLSEEERATKSKHNYDLFRRRWHHGENLLTANYRSELRHFGHDHQHHVGGVHGHEPDELPPPGQAHSHMHQHWPDHSHEHPHVHNRR